MEKQLLQGSAKSRTSLKKGWLEGTVVHELPVSILQVEQKSPVALM